MIPEEWHVLVDGSWVRDGHRLEYLQNGAGRWEWVVDGKAGLGTGNPTAPPFDAALVQILRLKQNEMPDRPFEAVR